MIYEKLNLSNGTKLTADHLAHMEDGIADAVGVATAAEAAMDSALASADDATEAANRAEAAAAAIVNIPARFANKRTKTGKLIAIDDAADEMPPVSIPDGAIIYSRNMYPVNVTSRTTNGVTFSVPGDDGNAILVDGTATSNAYSFGTISEANATMLLNAGKFHFCLYDESGLTRAYIDQIPAASGTKTSSSYESNEVVTIELSEPTYVGLRVQVRSGVSLTNQMVYFYVSKVKPVEYVPYKAPSNVLMYAHSIVVCTNETDAVTYYTTRDAESATFKLATFNLGGYGYGDSRSDDPVGDVKAYTKYIAGLDADILCTQEDRLYYKQADEVTTRSQIYDYMYPYGDIVSNSTSNNGIYAKGIYSTIPLRAGGKYTFENQGTQSDGTEKWASFSYFVADVNGNNVLVLSVHLVSRESAALYETNLAARRLQVAEVVAFVGKTMAEYGCEHAIIAGDFNVWEDEMDGFGGAFVMANCGPFGEMQTFTSEDSHPFDNILVTPNIKMRGVKVHENSFGDHYAVSATLTI